MRFRTIKYQIEQGVNGLLKNRLMALASIATVGACAFILIISLCIVINLDHILEQFETTVGITVFLGEEVTDEEVESIKNSIEEIENIKTINFVSEVDALEWAKEKWGDDSDILEGLELDNPLPRSFEIMLDGIKYQKNVINQLEVLQLSFENEMLKNHGLIETVVDSEEQEITTVSSNEAAADEDAPRIGEKGYKFLGIEKIRHAQKESQVLMTINTTLRIVSVVLILVMCVVSIGIITNTIKLAVFIRKNEINIMKYVGATDWFIRFPFVIEGILIGLIGSLIPCLICWAIYSNLVKVANEKMIIMQNIASLTPSHEIFVLIVPITLILGSALGAFGSITSIRKHLNV